MIFPESGLDVEHESIFDSHRWTGRTGFFLSILNVLFILFIHVKKS